MTNTNYKITAAHVLRKYLWSRLSSELGWDTANYGGLTPITTSEQQPEFNNNSIDAPYIVYGFMDGPPGQVLDLQQQTVAFSIFSSKNDDIVEAINLINADLRRFDESANAINDFIQASSLSNTFKEFDFKSVMVTGSRSPEPITQEGGRRDGYITIQILYTQYNQYGDRVR